MKEFRTIEICAGAGGQALGLEQAGFKHLALVEIDPVACQSLRINRPNWNVIEGDLRDFNAERFKGVELLAGGVPCPPFSVAGKQLGDEDERDMFPQAIRIAKECMPKAIMLENVRGLLGNRFKAYRAQIQNEFENLGYVGQWYLVKACDFGVPQLRPRALFIAFQDVFFNFFTMPSQVISPPTVGEALFEQMASEGWDGADAWKKLANGIAPTLVGGSKKHGGADLGPTRAKNAWADLGVDGKGLADSPPHPGFVGKPRLTVQMAATIQGFPKNWIFEGKKTPAYRQVGNAFPPPVSNAIGQSIRSALLKETPKPWQKNHQPELSFENTL